VESSLGGTSYGWQAPLIKSAFTGVTLGFGGSGGIITPIFFMGSTAGAAFASTFHLDVATFAAIGLVSLVAGAAQTPIAASIMAMELFGPAIAPYAAMACVISFLMTGHRSVYPSQILAIRKSESLKVELGEEIDAAEPVYQRRKGSLIDLAMRAGKKVSEMRAEHIDKGAGI
jgi:H+/Cl- antiporter ClcA